MDNTAISVRNVGKMYPLYADPRDRLRQSLWYTLPKFLRSSQPPEFYKEFWALRDVSFEVKKGETVGIIGQNGSGKSTLLQIIAGTLAPTWGEVEVNGRVAALLELGSGFNPEFTGRENVYLNGSILGLTQTEIDELYDDIVAFADIGQFIDQPVKLYSSGMAVRLAFAVQAFVPKQVLIVDEALAVGDGAFQRKCMVSLENFRNNGGTVLLVSHDTQTIVRQCDRCMLLSQGKLVTQGATKPVTDLYQKLMYSDSQEVGAILQTLHEQGLERALAESRASIITVNGKDGQYQARPPSPADSASDWFDPNLPTTREITYGNGSARIIDFGMYNTAGQKVNVLVCGRRYRWTYQVEFLQEAFNVDFGMSLKATDGLVVSALASKREQVKFDRIEAGAVLEISFALSLNITPGQYFLNAGVMAQVRNDDIYLHRRVDVCMIRVIAPTAQERQGVAYVDPQFQYRFVN